MQQFIERKVDRITGVLSGFDRILFRGTMRALSYLEGMDKYLNVKGVLYYRVTKRGHEVMTTAQKLRNMTVLAAAT